MSPPTDHYGPGGADLEMRTIATLLQMHAPGRVHDGNHRWGVRAGDLEPLLRQLDNECGYIETMQ